jgi:diguanylate cyclase (GGDEF)-like protein
MDTPIECVSAGGFFRLKIKYFSAHADIWNMVTRNDTVADKLPVKRPLVLVVDDEDSARLIARASLEHAGLAVEEAPNGREGVDAFERLRPDLVLMDVLMPEMDGFAACAAIRSLPGGGSVPILMLTGLDDVESIRKAYLVGATDFTTKPIHATVLGYRANYLIRAGRAFGDLHQAEAENRALLQALSRKNEELKRFNKALLDQATHDGLTGLYNYRYFQEALSREIARSTRHGKSFSLILLDVDSFKRYNDKNGHQLGDDALRIIGEILLQRIRKSDIAARYGGDEFVVLLPEVGREHGMQIAEALREAIAGHPFHGRKTQPRGSVTASFGMAVYPEDGPDHSSLFREADRTMYLAKEAGGNCVYPAAGQRA